MQKYLYAQLWSIQGCKGAKNMTPLTYREQRWNAQLRPLWREEPLHSNQLLLGVPLANSKVGKLEGYELIWYKYYSCVIFVILSPFSCSKYARHLILEISP